MKTPHLLIILISLACFGCSSIKNREVIAPQVTGSYNPQIDLKRLRTNIFTFKGEIGYLQEDGFSHCYMVLEQQASASLINIHCSIETIATKPNAFIYANFYAGQIEGEKKLRQLKTNQRTQGVCLDSTRLCSTQEIISLQLPWQTLYKYYQSARQREASQSAGLSVRLFNQTFEEGIRLPGSLLELLQAKLDE